MIRPEDLEAESTFSFCRSSGPGGQHVNKTETKVQMKWNPMDSALISPEQREQLLKYWKGKLLSDGTILVESEKTRSQWRNKKDAIAKLILLIQSALTPVAPRIPSKVPKAAKEMRRKEKEHRSEIKASRRL